MKQIIVINGTGESGKDTFVEMVSKYAKVLNFSSIDKVKEIARFIGWNGGKTDKDRRFLSDLKRLTTAYNDMAYLDMKDHIDQFYSGDYEIMFIHIREPEEISRVVLDFGVKTLLIKRENHENIMTNKSDANVENYSYDYSVFNTTLEKLELDAKDFVSCLKSLSE